MNRSRVIKCVVAFLLVWFLLGVASDFVHNENYHWNVVAQYLFNPRIIEGVGWTLFLTVASMVLGVVVAATLAMLSRSKSAFYRSIAKGYILIFRGTPVYTQLVFWGLISVLLPKLIIGIPFTSIEFFSFGTRDIITALVAAVLGLGLNEGAYLSEIMRAGLDSVPQGQNEAGTAIGMSSASIFWRITLPQAMRVIIPPTGNETISMLKTTSLVVAVPFTMDLAYIQGAIANRIYFPIPMLLVACLWYLAITSILMLGQHFLEKKFGKGIFTAEG